MKKINSKWMTALFFTAAFNITDAQTLQIDNDICTTGFLSVSFFPGDAGTNIDAGSIDLNRINAKAVRDFSRFYTANSGEKWYVASNGYFAKFSLNGNKGMAAYDLKGHWMFTIFNYGENKLPDDIRAAVRSTYYNYEITCIDEIHFEDQIIYQVHMQDEKTWKNLLVSNGEMEISEDFYKK
ncbi:MAG: hypothetical protein ACHQET_03355 [Chitinophagales bacterium]